MKDFFKDPYVQVLIVWFLLIMFVLICLFGGILS